MTDERVDPQLVADERTTLTEFLDYYRATIERKATGLTDEQVRSTPGPSDLSLLGLVRHMAEVERNWFRRKLRGDDAPPLYYDDEDRDRDFHPRPDETLADAVTAYRAECAYARQVTAATPSLDELAVVPVGDGEIVSLRWILVHMIEETARHAGHADLLRESIDGATGD